MFLSAFTIVHVIISLLGIGSGLVVVTGLLTSKRFDGWTAIFLATTVATSVTGFLFPVDRFMPSHGVGIVSLLVLPVAIFARFRRQMVGHWRLVFVITAAVALYLNVFVLVVQLFLKVPVLKAMAPTQSEPPFAVTQFVVLLVFVAIGIAAAIRFRPDARPQSLPAFGANVPPTTHALGVIRAKARIDRSGVSRRAVRISLTSRAPMFSKPLSMRFGPSVAWIRRA
jgi:hypothetical protein